MTTENIRIVAIEATSSQRLYICQVDTGFPITNRPTFAMEIPPWVITTLKVGDVLPISLSASRVEAAGGGLTTSSITTYTFAPGGTPDVTNRIYTTWSALMTAHNADGGLRLIYFDDTAASIIITAGTHTFNNRTRLLPLPGRPTPMAISLVTGAILDRPYYISPSLNFQV